MKLLLLKKFNNYFNRTISLYSTTAEYISHASSSKVYTDTNFNPNDGIHTKHIIGKGKGESFAINECDYLVCYDVDDNNVETIVSRWYIIEAVRTRANQYELTLKRDTIADNFNTLMTCPAYIRKGTVSDDNPLILNDEGIRVNQIKSGETLLKDGTSSAWIVGYMPKNGGTDGNVSVQIPTEGIKYETIESMATALGVDANDLNNSLTTAQNNPSYFINDNIEVVGWVNSTEGSSFEWRLIAGSQNNLASVSYGKFDFMTHNPTSDCFARENSDVDYISRLHFDGFGTCWKENVSPYVSDIKNGWKTWTGGKPFYTRQVYDKLRDYVKSETLIYKAGTYYKLKVGTITGPTNTNYTVSALAAPFATICSNFVNDWNTNHHSSHYNRTIINNNAGNIFINYNQLGANFYLEEVTTFEDVPGITFSMSSTRNPCRDSVYDMFAIPFSNVQIKEGANIYDGIGGYSQQLAVAIAQKMSAQEYDLYDLQLLPYCPVPELASNGKIDLGNFPEDPGGLDGVGYDYDYIYQTGTTASDSKDLWGSLNEYAPGQYEAEFIVDTGVASADFISKDAIILQNDSMTPNIQLSSSTSVVNNQVRISYYGQVNNVQDPDHIQVRVMWTYTSHDPVVKSVIIYPKSSSFSVNINQTLSLKDSMKIEALCNSYRLVAPNYQGSFDFNVAKNGGSCSGFIAECTYKPYTPYIKVAPNFSWMYGTSYGDARGLVCSGDFSLGRVNSAWESYQLQNKNYQNIFNREIQNLDVNQSIARQQQGWMGSLGIVNSATQGAMTGALVGGGYGAAAGAVIGGTASAAGMFADLHYMDRQLVEQRQFAIDKYGLQLGNIQAIPYTLTKVGAFDINSKIWPFLEYYTCTDTEKEYLENKIRYEGMTVGVVDALGSYMITGSYLQADLIRNAGIMEDSHTVEDIYVELTKGVYL